MRNSYNMNRVKNSFITLKRFIFITLIIIIIFPININSTSNSNSHKVIKFKLNGDIIISDTENNNIIENTKLNSRIIYTKINEKNINFKDTNILPTQNGELNYIDPYQHITLLDISLEEFIINSPMIIKKYPNLLFISNRTMSLFSININNGSINFMENYNKNLLNKNDFLRYVKDVCPKNEEDVLFLRFDYYLQMKYTYVNNNNKNKINDQFSDIIWQSHYVKIIPIYPQVNIETNNTFIDYDNFENEDYYIFEVIDNKNINLIYSQDKDIFLQIKDVQNDFNFDSNYYFGNNKRKHLFEYNIIKKDIINKRNLSFKFLKKFFLLIIIFVLSAFSLRFLKISIIKNYYKNKFIQNNNINNINKNKIPPLQSNLINIDNNENNNKINIDIKQENTIEKPISPKCKSISNLSTSCSIDMENKKIIIQSIEKDILFSSLNNIKFNNFKVKNSSSGKKRDFLKNSSSRLSNHKRRYSHKRTSSIKQLFKEKKIISEQENDELKNLFNTYISDINKNTCDSGVNLNFNLSENEENYKKIYSLIKSDDSSSSEEININEGNQGFFAGELENNFIFYFDNGRLLKCYKDFQFIGKGGFGVVFKATNKIDESQWAIKVMKINLDLKEENEDLKVTQEIKTMLKFKNKNIVRYKTCWFEFNQKRVKKKRKRAMSLEQRNPPTIDFKNDFLESGEKKIKNRLKKHLKTPLERIQSISKELKLAEKAEKQKNTPKTKARKGSIIWDSEEEDSDVDSLGANKNYAIKEEGEDKYINLDDNEENEIDDDTENVYNDNDGDYSNSQEIENSNEKNNDNDVKINFDNTNNDNDNDNGINEFNENENNNDIIFYDSSKKEESENKNRSLQKVESSNSKNNEKSNNEDSNKKEYEYENLRNKNLYESSSKNIDNTNSDDIKNLNLDKDSENNSIFKEEIEKERQELNKQKNSNEQYNNDSNNEDSFDDEDDDDLKNNSEDGLGISKQNKKKKKKKYPIYFFIQMEYCSGCPMNYYLSHRSAVPSKKLTTYMLYQMCKAVKHIHDGNIIHRDLKPGNIFIIDDYLIKIGDFGLALNSEKIQEKQGGTYLYQSPEQINNQPYDEKIDIFALGVILVELVSKFNTEFERREILHGLKKSCYPEYLKKDHLKEYNLVVKMTRLNPKERPNIKEILKDNDFIELINESLNSD